MYVHHVDGAPQIIHMECSPIRRHADRPRTAHFDQVTPGAQFRTLADESPLSVVGDGSPAAATVQSFMDLEEAQELPEAPTRPVDSPAESYDSHLEAFRPVQAGVFFGVEKLKGEPMFNGFSLGAEPSTPTKRASPSFISPDGVEGFNFEGGIDEGDMSPTKKSKVKRGRATPPRHKLPILFF